MAFLLIYDLVIQTRMTDELKRTMDMGWNYNLNIACKTAITKQNNFEMIE